MRNNAGIGQSKRISWLDNMFRALENVKGRLAARRIDS